jgi:hypothetical protein
LIHFNILYFFLVFFYNDLSTLIQYIFIIIANLKYINHISLYQITIVIPNIEISLILMIIQLLNKSQIRMIRLFMNLWLNWIMKWLDFIILEINLKSWTQDIQHYKHLWIVCEINNNIQWTYCELKLWSINKIIFPTNDKYIE